MIPYPLGVYSILYAMSRKICYNFINTQLRTLQAPFFWTGALFDVYINS